MAARKLAAALRKAFRSKAALRWALVAAAAAVAVTALVLYVRRCRGQRREGWESQPAPVAKCPGYVFGDFTQYKQSVTNDAGKKTYNVCCVPGSDKCVSRFACAEAHTGLNAVRGTKDFNKGMCCLKDFSGLENCVYADGTPARARKKSEERREQEDLRRDIIDADIIGGNTNYRENCGAPAREPTAGQAYFNPQTFDYYLKQYPNRCCNIVGVSDRDPSVRAANCRDRSDPGCPPKKYWGRFGDKRYRMKCCDGDRKSNCVDPLNPYQVNKGLYDESERQEDIALLRAGQRADQATEINRREETCGTKRAPYDNYAWDSKENAGKCCTKAGGEGTCVAFDCRARHGSGYAVIGTTEANKGLCCPRADAFAYKCKTFAGSAQWLAEQRKDEANRERDRVQAALDASANSQCASTYKGLNAWTWGKNVNGVVKCCKTSQRNECYDMADLNKLKKTADDFAARLQEQTKCANRGPFTDAVSTGTASAAQWCCKPGANGRLDMCVRQDCTTYNQPNKPGPATVGTTADNRGMCCHDPLSSLGFCSLVSGSAISTATSTSECRDRGKFTVYDGAKKWCCMPGHAGDPAYCVVQDCNRYGKGGPVRVGTTADNKGMCCHDPLSSLGYCSIASGSAHNTSYLNVNTSVTGPYRGVAVLIDRDGNIGKTIIVEGNTAVETEAIDSSVDWKYAYVSPGLLLTIVNMDGRRKASLEGWNDLEAIRYLKHDRLGGTVWQQWDGKDKIFAASVVRWPVGREFARPLKRETGSTYYGAGYNPTLTGNAKKAFDYARGYERNVTAPIG